MRVQLLQFVRLFGCSTVWYELLAGSWPFQGFSAESIIWQVGNGKKQNLSQLQGGKDVKVWNLF